MVAVGAVAGRGRVRLMVWFDDRGLPKSSSLERFDDSTGDPVGTWVIACEPFDTLPIIWGRLQLASSAQLELPLD